MNLRPVPVVTATALAALTLGLLVGTPPATARPAIPAAPTVNAAIAGEQAVASGGLGPRTARRSVRLERRAGKRWTVVARTRTTGTGRYRFVLRQAAATTSYRVVAPRQGKRRPTVRSRVRIVRPLAQAAHVLTPSSVSAYEGLTVRLRFTPARPGRPWVLQNPDGARFASGVQDAAGRGSAAIGSGPAGALRLRVVASAWRGAPAVSTAHTVVVRPGAPDPDPEPEPEPTPDPRVRLVSHTSDGSPLDADVEEVAVDGTGRWVAFTSTTMQLGVADPQGVAHLYLADTLSGTTTLVSRNVGGVPADASSYSPAISADGRYVVWSSPATNLVAEDGNGTHDIFRHDRVTGRVSVVSVLPSGLPAGRSVQPAISPDGRWVTFATRAYELAQDPWDHQQVVRWDSLTATFRLVTPATGRPYGANGSSSHSRVTDAGDVTVTSWATNLLAGDTLDSRPDLYVWRAATGAFTKVSRFDGNGPNTPLLTVANGSALVFESVARVTADDTDDASDVFLQRAVDGATTLLSTGPGVHTLPSIASDGTRASWQTELGGRTTVSRHDLTVGVTTDALLPPYGGTTSASARAAGLSGDGGTVLYLTSADDLVGRPAGGRAQLVAVRSVAP